MKFLISHPFNQPVANTTLWVYESFVSLEYFMWDLWCGWSGNGGGFPLSFFHLPLPITTPPMLLLYVDPVVCNNPYQVAHYQILGIQVVGLISNLTHGWLQNSEVLILHTTHTKDHDRHNMSMCVMFTGYQGKAMIKIIIKVNLLIKIIIKVNLHHVPVLPLDNLSCLYPQQDEH
jgi:hypothetical protein